MATLDDHFRLAAFNAAMEGRGNTKLVWGTYVGDGEYGENHPNTLTFDGVPLYVEIRPIPANNQEALKLTCGKPVGSTEGYGLSGTISLTWGERSVSWYNRSSSQSFDQFNASGIPHYYLALLGI